MSAPVHLAPRATAAQLGALAMYGQTDVGQKSLKRIPIHLITNLISAAASGMVRYATVALMNADTTSPEGTLATVDANNGSASDLANGVYQKVAGGWVLAAWYGNMVLEAVQPIATQIYDDADSASAAAGDATAAAAAAAASQALVEAMAGVPYISIAAGLAGTAEGQVFAVNNGDGTNSIYRKVAGAAVFSHRMATTAALSADTGGLLVGSFPHLAALKAVPKSLLTNNQRATTRGFATPGDGDIGEWLWLAGSAEIAITGFIEPADEGGNGRWVRQHGNVINDRMAGAKVDNIADDTATLGRLAAIIMAQPSIYKLDFVRGSSKALPAGMANAITCFALSNRPGFEINASGRFWNSGRTYAESLATGNSILFSFSNCQSLRFLGYPLVTGPLDSDTIKNSAQAYGSYALVLFDNCSFSAVQVRGEGISCPLLANRLPKIRLNPGLMPFVGAPGANYAPNDVLSVPSIGSNAEVNATVTVNTVDGAGGILTWTVTNPGRYPAFYDAGILNTVKGFAVTGGSGTGALISPYTLDDSDITSRNKSRNCDLRIEARTCFYGINAQWNIEDSWIEVDTDVVYRAYFCYGGENNRGIVKIRNQHRSSFSGCVAGIPTSADLILRIRPATLTGFGTNSCAMVMSFGSSVAGVNRLRLAGEVDRRGSTPCGQHFMVEKFGLVNGVGPGNDASPRGHIGYITFAGAWRGRGANDSGATNNVIGTNVNYPANSWKGDKLYITQEDSFTITDVESSWGIGFIAHAVASWIVGNVDVSCSMRLDPLLEGIGLEAAGPVKVSAGAKFANRYQSVGAHWGLDYIQTGVNVALTSAYDGIMVENANTSADPIVQLPVWYRGARFGVKGNRTRRIDVSPQSNARIGDGAAWGGYDKDFRITAGSGMFWFEAGASTHDWVAVGVGAHDWQP